MKTATELDRHRYLNLATFRKSGEEVATPVWFAAAGGLWVVTPGNSGKVKRLRQSSRARIAPCDARGAARGPWLDVQATLVKDEHAIALAWAALTAKYGSAGPIAGHDVEADRAHSAARVDRDR